MSHRIHEHDKQQGITQAWHGLTEIVPDLSLDNNWLNSWDIRATQLFAKPDQSVTASTPTPFSILTATDDPSITIGVPFNPESYRPIKNAEFLGLLRDSTEGIEGTNLVSIGSVRNRGRVFASFETAQLETYKAGGREFKPYVNFGNGHDKSSVLWANTSNVCTVCDNTFQMNLNAVEKEVVAAVNARHTKNVALRLPDLGMIIRNAVVLQQNFAVAFEALAETKVSFANAEAIFTGFVAQEAPTGLSTRARNIVERLMGLFKSGRGNKGENLADLFSAVTDFYTHENAGNGKNPGKQFQSSEFGTGAQRKQAFWLNLNGDNGQMLLKQGLKALEIDRLAKK